MSETILIGMEGLTLIGLAIAGAVIWRSLARNFALTAELRQHIDMLQHAEKLGRIGTWKIDVKSQRLHWSDRVFQIHDRKVTFGEPPLENAISYYHPDDRDMVQTAVDRALRDGVQFEFTARLLTETGKEKKVFSRGMCALDSQGHVDRVYGVFIETAHVIQLADFVNDNLGLEQPDRSA